MRISNQTVIANPMRCIVSETYLGDEEVDCAGLLPAPRGQLHHEALRALKHKLSPPQAPLDGHLLRPKGIVLGGKGLIRSVSG